MLQVAVSVTVSPGATAPVEDALKDVHSGNVVAHLTNPVDVFISSPALHDNCVSKLKGMAFVPVVLHVMVPVGDIVNDLHEDWVSV